MPSTSFCLVWFKNHLDDASISRDLMIPAPGLQGASQKEDQDLSLQPLICCRLTGRAADPHKPLFPLSWEDWVGYGFAAISLFIAAGGGIGGGGILVPLYILLLGAHLPGSF